jgi:hypothetical protein
MSASAVATASPVKKFIVKLSVVVAVTLAVGVAAATFSVAAASASTTNNWIMTGWNIHQLDQLSPATANHFFNTPNSYATGSSNSTSPVSDGFTTSSVLVYTSYAQFASDIANHAIAPSYQWVMYDPEFWSATPVNEQQNPAQYMQEFGQLAHANGLKVIETPGRDLGLVPGSVCPETAGESLDHWYLRCNIPAAAASSADVVVVQDQVNTTNPAEFDSLYSSSESQAQGANPQVVVDPELSTSYGTAAQMATAAESAHTQGIYINATTPEIGKTRAFLHAMQVAGY